MKKNIAFGVGTYLKEDYAEILLLSEDRDNLDETWEDWLLNKQNHKRNLKKEGVDAIDVIVKPKELVDYCRSHGLKINGSSRAEFVSFKGSEILNK